MCTNDSLPVASASMPSDRKREQGGSQTERYEVFKVCLCVVSAHSENLLFACRIPNKNNIFKKYFFSVRF